VVVLELGFRLKDVTQEYYFFISYIYYILNETIFHFKQVNTNIYKIFRTIISKIY